MLSYLFGIFHAWTDVRKIEKLKKEINFFLKELHPIYKNILKRQKQTGKEASRKSIRRRFVKQLRRQDKIYCYKELLHLIPKIETANPYLTRYIHIGKKHDVLTNFLSMIQVNRFLTKSKAALKSNLRHAISPLPVLKRFIELPITLFTSLFQVKVNSEVLALSIGVLIWASGGLLVLYQNEVRLIFQVLFAQ